MKDVREYHECDIEHGPLYFVCTQVLYANVGHIGEPTTPLTGNDDDPATKFHSQLVSRSSEPVLDGLSPNYSKTRKI